MRGLPWTFVPVAVFMAALLLPPMSAQAPKRVQILDFDSRSDRDAVSKAREALEDGDIVRITGASEADVVRLFGSKLGNFKVLNQSGPADVSSPKGATIANQLTLQAAAGYKDAHGVVHTVQSFTSDGQGGKPGRRVFSGDQKPADHDWQKRLDDWVTREHAKITQAAIGDPEPPQQAWTTLYTTTVQATSNYGNFEQSTIAVYRLINTDPNNDYYMVYTVPEVTPAYNGTCDGYAECGWHTISRSFVTQATEATALSDHGPTGTVGEETVGFNIGGSLSPAGPGASAAFSATWSQPDVTTVDGSTGTVGRWDETFHFNDVFRCNPAFGSLPAVSTGTFFSRQGAIFQVPGGSPAFNTQIETQAEFCSYSSYVGNFGNNYDSVSIQTNLSLGPPTLYATPLSLTIPAGQSATLLVSAFIPGSSQGFAWNVSTNHPSSWLTVPTNGPFSTGQAIQVSVAPNTPDGSTGTISVDSSPPFAAPSVESGPIQVQVTVGTPTAQNSAGVLLMGGTTVANAIAATPEVFDATTQQAIPTGLPNFAPTGHTATLLSNGDILIVGGVIKLLPNFQNIPTNAAQVFHPATKTFSPTGSMNTARSGHTATLLPDGKVLVTGGVDGNGSTMASAELYDPSTGAFTPAGSMQAPRVSHTANLTSQPGQPAQVIVYAGYTSGKIVANPTWELWSEATDTFTSQGSMATAQSGFPTPLPLSDGRLVIAGGSDNNFQSLATEQLLTLNTQSFQLGQALNVSRSSHTLTALPAAGELLAIGGLNNQSSSDSTLGSAEVRDANGWTLLSGANTCPGSAGCLLTPRSQHTATLLPNGTIFVAGGSDSSASVLGSTEFYQPGTKSFASGPIVSPRSSHTATLFATSTTTLTVSPNPSTVGQTVTLAASVSALTGTPSGSVQFLDGSTVLQTVPLNGGQATFNTSALTAGSHSLTAVYLGNGIPAASSSQAVTQTVNQVNTTVSVSSSPNPSSVGQAVMFIATVRPTPSGGSVTFKDGTATLGTSPVTNGTASLTTSTLALGQHAITAIFSGSGNDGGSTSPVFTQTVGANTTTTTLRILPKNAVFGQTLTLMARVTSAQGTPTGTVTFASGSTTLGTAPLVNGLAKFNPSTLSAGTYSFIATYSGNSNYSSSAGPGSLTINKATPTVEVSSSPNPSRPDQNFVLTATISTPYGTPTGSVTFKDTSQTLGVSPVINGKATLTTYYVIPGTHYITAQYSGDGNYVGSISSPYPQQVNVTQ